MENIIFDPKNIKLVPIDTVRPNDWNPKEDKTDEYQTVLESIRLKGLRQPIYVRQNKGMEIVDGEQRWTACKELEYKNIIVYDMGVVSDQEAKEITAWFEMQVPFNEVMLAKFIKDIVDKYENYELPYSQEQIDNYVKMAEFDFSQFNKDSPESTNVEMFTYTVTQDQKKVIDQAIELVRQESSEISEGRALELISADYIGSGGVNQNVDDIQKENV